MAATSIILRRARQLIPANPLSLQLAHFTTSSSSPENEPNSETALEPEPDNYMYFDKSGDKVWRTRVKLALPRNKAKDYTGATGGLALIFVDPRSDSPEVVAEHTRDVVQAEKDILKKEQGYYGPFYHAASDYLKARTSPAVLHIDGARFRDGVVGLIERLKSDVYLGDKNEGAGQKEKSGEQQAEVSQKSLQGWYPILYRALSRYTTVGNQVIIHIDYDHALDALIYLLSDESDKKNDDDDDVKKRKLSLEQQVKLSQMLRDIENRSKGMPLSTKMGLLKIAVMLFTQQEYPDIHQGIGIMDMLFSFFRGSKSPTKEVATLMSCNKGLLVLLEAPGLKTAERLRVKVEKEWLVVEGIGETTAGFKDFHEKVEIPHEHAYEQEGVIAELSDGEIKVLFPFASERGRIDDSFSVNWGKVDI